MPRTILRRSGSEFSQDQSAQPDGFGEQLRLSDLRDACLGLRRDSCLYDFCCTHRSQCAPKVHAELSCISPKIRRNCLRPHGYRQRAMSILGRSTTISLAIAPTVACLPRWESGHRKTEVIRESAQRGHQLRARSAALRSGSTFGAEEPLFVRDSRSSEWWLSSQSGPHPLPRP